jgi:class 3 adenylate cyclase
MGESSRDRNAASSRLAWGLWAATMALSISGFVLLLLTLDVPVSSVYGARGMSVLVAIPFATMAAFLASRRPDNPIGWLFAAAGLSLGLVAFGEGYATYSFAEHQAALPLSDPIAWAQNWLWVALIAFGLVYPFLLFPEGKLPSRRWRLLAWAAPAVMLAFGMAVALEPGQLQSVADGYMNPYTIRRGTLASALEVLGPPFLLVILLPVVAFALRFRRSTGDQHEQMKWLLFAGTLTAISLAANMVVTIAGVGGAAFQVVAVLTQICIGGIAIAAGVAVLRYRLYDIDVVINRAVVFGLVAGFITLAYVGIVVGVGALVGSWGGSSLVLPIVATAFVAVAFQPVRQRANRFADRLVYGRRTTPYEALAGVDSGQTLDELLPQIARLATESTAARGSTVWLSTGVELQPAAEWPADDVLPSPVPLEDGQTPDLPEADHTYSLIHQGDLLGAVAVRMGAGETLPPADNRLLSDLASHAAVALRGVLEAVPLPTGIVTFLMTDVEGSTRLWEEDAGAMGAAMRQHDSLVRQRVRDRGGILIKWRGEGDSTFSVFTSATDAIAAAADIQDSMGRQAWATPRPLKLRAALHTGEAELRERDYFGPTVNRCARIRALAKGGQTLASAASRELARDALPETATLLDLGEHELKDLGPERVFELRSRL